jgi:general stress protein 26
MTTPASREAAGQGSLDELLRLLGEFDAAMLVTLDAFGRLRARPMGLQLQEKLPDCDLWLVSADDTPKTDEITQHHEINLCCLRARDKAYVSISARARVERDPALARRLWRDDWKIWCGDERAADGAIAIVKLEVERAEYWEPAGGRLRVIFAAGPAADSDEASATTVKPKRIG